MSKINVGVLRGGPSLEYDMSLISGQAVIDSLDENKYNPVDILIDKNGEWFVKGLTIKPFELLSKLDVVFNALHGDFGEDGRVQNILEQAGVPFTGPKSFAAAVAYHKALALSEIKKNNLENLKMQGQLLFSTLDLLNKEPVEMVDEVFAAFAPPYVLKPVKSGSSFGISVANTKEELLNLLEKMLIEYDEVLVEEFIIGKELTVSLVEKMRGEDLYVAPPLEILKKEKKIFDTDAKYLEAREETVRFPALVDDAIKSRLEEVSRKIFRILEARHYARIDFVVARDKDIYFLELNSLPGLGPSSLLPQTLQAVGIHFPDFVEIVLGLAMNEK